MAHQGCELVQRLNRLDGGGKSLSGAGLGYQLPHRLQERSPLAVLRDLRWLGCPRLSGPSLGMHDVVRPNSRLAA
jgi:hypothetical protein